ncbi:hypothetical protein L6R52_42440, partial [Myxococcota bacterium]|nr:hypothetical protein [Myxococcota bacterium]
MDALSPKPRRANVAGPSDAPVPQDRIASDVDPKGEPRAKNKVRAEGEGTSIDGAASKVETPAGLELAAERASPKDAPKAQRSRRAALAAVTPGASAPVAGLVAVRASQRARSADGFAKGLRRSSLVKGPV